MITKGKRNSVKMTIKPGTISRIKPNIINTAMIISAPKNLSVSTTPPENTVPTLNGSPRTARRQQINCP
jgi:hypothetical protein